MNNHIKNTRKTYDRFNAKVITEVLVQFKDEDPTWIPLSTYEAIPGIVLTSEETRYWNGELEGEDFEKALRNMVMNILHYLMITFHQGIK